MLDRRWITRGGITVAPTGQTQGPPGNLSRHPQAEDGPAAIPFECRAIRRCPASGAPLALSPVAAEADPTERGGLLDDAPGPLGFGAYLACPQGFERRIGVDPSEVALRRPAEPTRRFHAHAPAWFHVVGRPVRVAGRQAPSAGVPRTRVRRPFSAGLLRPGPLGRIGQRPRLVLRGE